MSFIRAKYFQNLMLLLFFIGMECIRSPDIFKYGRFWEDEAILFQRGWSHSFLDTVFYSYGGYLNLASNIFISLSQHLVPLQYAPYVTTLSGLCFCVLPLFLLLTAKDAWLQSFKTRLFATLLILLVPEHVELSMESLHIQFWLIFSIIVILILQPTKHQRYFRVSILILTALSSLIAFVIVPIFGIRYLIERNRLRLVQFCMLTLGSLIQYFFFYGIYKARDFDFSWIDYLSVFFTRNFISPFIGLNSYSFKYLETIYDAREKLLIPSIPCIGSILFFIVLLYCFWKYSNLRSVLGTLIATLLMLQFVGIYGAIGPVNWFYHMAWNQRYVFLTQTSLVLILLYLSANLPIRGQYLCGCLIIWLSIVGFHNFFTIKQTAPTSALTWKQQVTLWKNDPKISFIAWPGNRIWNFTLSK